MTHFLAAIVLAQAPVRKAVSLVGGETPEPVANWSFMWWMLIAAGVVIVLIAGLAYRWSRTTHVDRAFGLMAFMLRLRRRERRLVRDLAGAATEPVALLLSEHAFTQAVSERERSGTGVDPALVLRLRRRVFG